MFYLLSDIIDNKDIFNLQKSIFENLYTIKPLPQSSRTGLYWTYVGCISLHIYFTYNFSDTLKVKITVKFNFRECRHEGIL